MHYLRIGDIFKNPSVTLILGIIIFILLFVFFWTFLIIYYERLNAMRLAQEKLRAEIANEVNNARNEIQQATLNNISQEIHDNVGQLLSLTKMQLNLIEAQEVKDNNLISEAKDNISKAMTDLRDLAKGMSSDRIQLLGLYDSVSQEAVRINKVGRLQVQVSSSGTKKEPEHKKQLVVFRVIQECFQNIIKHAQANHVLVTFTYQLDSFEVLIKDDGIGFDYHPGSPASEGLGLMNIFNRIHLVGGDVTLNSSPGAGTTIHIKVPL
jgi:two-component system, NarL family, sensor kinase